MRLDLAVVLLRDGMCCAEDAPWNRVSVRRATLAPGKVRQERVGEPEAERHGAALDASSRKVREAV